MRAVVDTNALIYYIFKDQKMHKVARKVLNSLSIWLIPDVVIHELIWFLRGSGVENKTAFSIISEILVDKRAELLHIRKEDYLEAVLNGLDDFEDRAILIAAYNEGTLVSFDEKLRERASKLRIHLLPEEI
ncbi:MAG: VapC toxin family PIN domain ribonuclease [Thermoproteota archaeon]|nr:MAG: VapC toxin family PIN domain ribonuclease [Candidatus Korarchaeota archaeon]